MKKVFLLVLFAVLAAGLLPTCSLSQELGYPVGGSISGCKYYDLNYNGCRDWGEKGIPGFKIALYVWLEGCQILVSETYTNAYGGYCFPDLPPGYIYIVKECLPIGCWLQTGPKDFENAYVMACEGIYKVYLRCSEYGIDFGNVCLGAGGGKTPGFWSNKNGQELLTQNWTVIANSGILSCSVLAGLPNTNASAPYLTSPEQIKIFMLNSNAVDMQYKLGSQWLAMALNIVSGSVDPNAQVWDGVKFIRLGDLVQLTCTNGATWDRYTQEYAKNILDSANNNKIFLQCKPCPVVYPTVIY